VSLRIERLLPVVRAVLAARLVKVYGVRKSKVAKVLGVSPAAVSQYISGERGRAAVSLGSPLDGEVEALAERLARKISLGLLDSASSELEVFLHQLMSAGKAGEGGRAHGTDRAALKILMDRLVLEEEAAHRALELSSSASSQFAKMVLKQLAVDSMRHADILAAIIHALEKGEDIELTKDDLALLADMWGYERRAEDVKLAETSLTVSRPVLTALLASIDMDEKKHEMLLESIVGGSGGERIY